MHVKDKAQLPRNIFFWPYLLYSCGGQLYGRRKKWNFKAKKISPFNSWTLKLRKYRVSLYGSLEIEMCVLSVCNVPLNRMRFAFRVLRDLWSVITFHLYNLNIYVLCSAFGVFAMCISIVFYSRMRWENTVQLHKIKLKCLIFNIECGPINSILLIAITSLKKNCVFTIAEDSYVILLFLFIMSFV